MQQTTSQTPASVGAEVARAYSRSVLLPYQLQWIQDRTRYRSWCASRQVGKSFGVSLDADFGGLEGRNQILVAASQRQSYSLILKAVQHLRALETALDLGFRRRLSRAGPKLVEGNPTKSEIVLVNGARIMAFPAAPDTIRGETGDVWIDEAGLVQHDEELFRAVFPMATRGGYRVSLVSTPFGDSGLFHRIHCGDSTRWSRHTTTVHDAMRQGLSVDWPAIQEAVGDPDAIAQEYECQFLSDALAYFPSDLIRRCTYDDETETVPPGSCYAGADIGRKKDRTTLYPLTMAASDVRYVLPGQVLHRMPFDEQEQIISGTLTRLRVRRSCVDATGLGAHIAENLQRRNGGVEPVVFTASIKEQLVTTVRKLMEQGKLRLPASDRDLLRDFGMIRRFVSAANNVRFDAEHSATGHADRFWAVALAVHASPGQTQRIEYEAVGESIFNGSVW